MVLRDVGWLLPTGEVLALMEPTSDVLQAYAAGKL
jgi:hypothetical protein